MDKIQIALSNILKDFINCKRTESFEIDWSALYSVSKNHQVSGIVYYQCKDFCSDDRFRVEFLCAIKRYSDLTHEFNKIETVLNSHDAKFFPVKGIEIARYYAIPSLRTMGDIDIVAFERREIDKILNNMGYSISYHPDNHEWTYHKGYCEIELHDRLVYNQPINTLEIESFFNEFRLYEQGNHIDDSFHFLYLILHLRKHFMNEGVGIRQFFDIATMIRNCDGLNWEWIERNLISLKLNNFSEKVFALIYRWFDIIAPILKIEISDAFFESATEKIFNNGVFGFCNEKNAKNVTINSIETYRTGRGWLEIIKKLFPPYKELRNSKHFSFVKGKPYMLPLAWLYRFVYCICDRKIKLGKKIVVNANISKVDYETRLKELEQWGLI